MHLLEEQSVLRIKKEKSNSQNTERLIYSDSPVICSKQVTNDRGNYFPNTTELIIKHYFKTLDDSITTTLNRLVPIEQLTKLVIEPSDFPFEEIVIFDTEFTYLKIRSTISF